ncbi:MAG: class I SAM-dependent methyltransferase [Kiritimatiellae bacterium]|nr:class I SAM-dependent methyltransferase [Kiritimatiellia bacterium]MDD5522680.1 class I SAM-dependent methyltransferase [Kiritimatiellia bacterium]
MESQGNKNMASKESVQEFLNKHTFDGYQSIDLPHGLRIPGADSRTRVEVVFRHPVREKTVLDVGCRYGFFCHEAVRRGASSADGIDIDPTYVSIAQEIVGLWGWSNVSIERRDLFEIGTQERYDIVLFLNVLHHVLSPVEAMKKVAAITNELAVVEFPTVLAEHLPYGWFSRLILRAFCSRLPLAYIGSRAYHRAWYFSEAAFINLFVTHLELFKKVEWGSSASKGGRRIAYCWVK